MIEYRHLRFMAGFLAILVALLHLGHPTAGFPRLVELIQIGRPYLDPRPVAFTISGLGIILGVLATWNGLLSRERAYIAGMVMMTIYLMGWAFWHLTGHGGWWPWIPAGHYHDGNPIIVLWNHFWADSWDQTAKVLESITLALVIYLYQVDVRTNRYQ